MEHTSLSDALISLIPTYGPWIIFGIVALESAGVPFPGETILVAAALLAASTGWPMACHALQHERPAIAEAGALCKWSSEAIREYGRHDFQHRRNRELRQ